MSCTWCPYAWTEIEGILVNVQVSSSLCELCKRGYWYYYTSAGEGGR